MDYPLPSSTAATTATASAGRRKNPIIRNARNKGTPTSSMSKNRRLTALLLLLVSSLLLSLTVFWNRLESYDDLDAAVRSALLQQQHEQHDNNDKSAASSSRVSKTAVSLPLRPSLCNSSVVVTAYFTLKSKHSNDKYDHWMKNMLSLQDCMVIFTSADWVDRMWDYRHETASSTTVDVVQTTVVIGMNVTDLPMAQDFNESFWQHQLELDYERRIHQDYPLFWVWLSKSWFVTQAIQQRYFYAENNTNRMIYMWSDIGCFRTPPLYRGKRMIRHREMVPPHSLLQMAHHDPVAPPHALWNDKRAQRGKYFYHSGSQAIGYADTWMTFHQAFQETIQEFNDRDMFIGEDQMVMQSTCLKYPNLCAYVPFRQVRNDNHYFGLRYVVHHGGNYTYWRPPDSSANHTTHEQVVVS